LIVRISFMFAGVLALVVWLIAGEASATTVSLIRDTEIENTIRAYATPLFRAGQLDPSAVHIYVVNDNQINSFVAGGQNLFINTGLLMKSRSANEVIGVIAHETGHIADGHLIRVQDAVARNTAENILAMILGAAAAAAGRPDVGTAVALGTQNVATRSYLQYSRTQEGSADAAAMRFLDDTHQSARGLLSFFQMLSKQDLLVSGRQDPYLRTHPLTQDRIEALQAFVAQSPYSNVPEKPEFVEMYRRMIAKLVGYLDDPAEVKRLYPDTDQSLEGRMARAIMLHRTNKPHEALEIMDGLLREHPNDPYLMEIKAQILLETNRPGESLPIYERIVALLPDAPLLRVDLARVELALNDPKLTEDAVHNLHIALAYEPDRPFVWRQLAVALGRDSKEGEAALALAEEALLLGKDSDARYYAAKAERMLPPSAPGALRAQDIQQVLDQKKPS
jgi:predicted Zn-dependent protease